MTRTKLYSELFNRYNRERRQFFFGLQGREWQTEFKNVKKNHDFIGAIYFVCIFLYAIFGSWMDYFVTVLCIVWICCFDSRNFNFLCFETKDSLSCGKYNLYIIYTGDVYNNSMD